MEDKFLCTASHTYFTPVGPVHTLSKSIVPHCGWQYHNGKKNTFRKFSSEDDMGMYSDRHRETEKYFLEKAVHSHTFTGDKETNLPVLANR